VGARWCPADPLVLKVREGGRAVNVHALVATGVNGDGHREILASRHARATQRYIRYDPAPPHPADV
jgi:transposase-like protein